MYAVCVYVCTHVCLYACMSMLCVCVVCACVCVCMCDFYLQTTAYLSPWILYFLNIVFHIKWSSFVPCSVNIIFYKYFIIDN